MSKTMVAFLLFFNESSICLHLLISNVNISCEPFDLGFISFLSMQYIITYLQ